MIPQREQALACTADSLQAVSDFFFGNLRFGQSQQCIAQGGYGSDGIHYFVRQYAGKPNPGIYFLFIQLVVDVVQGEDAQMFFTDCDVADADRHVDSASLVVERHLQFVSRAAIGKKGRKTRIHAVQLADVGKDIEAQQTEGFAVFLIYGTIVVQDKDTGIHAVQDEFVVFSCWAVSLFTL